MSSHICFLITVKDGDQLLECALKVERNDLDGDCAEYPMELENREVLHNLLPSHVKECGPIVAIEEIFEVCINNAK